MSNREEFEKVFPVPKGCEWSDALNQYCWLYTAAPHQHDALWMAWQAARATPALPQGVEEFISDRGIRDDSWYGSECVERTYILADDFREFARASLQKESEPVAHVVTHTTGGNAGLAKHIHWLPHGQSVMPGDLLYLHPTAPQAGMAIVPVDVIDDLWACAHSGYSLEDLKSKIQMLAATKEKGE